MEQPKDKAALVDTLRRERAFWQALLQVVDEADMLLPGVAGDWTFKDVVAHLTGWRKRTIARFLGSRQGGQPLPPEWPAELGDDTNQINDWMYRRDRDRQLRDVLAESRQVWQQLEETVQALPEDMLLAPGRFAWLEGQALGPANLQWSYAHLHEHAAMISDWLARRLDEA